VITACAAEPREVQTAPVATAFPQNYKTELLSYMRVYLNNPDGVRDAFISEPFIKTVGPLSRYVVCVRFTAKDKDGVYQGRTEGMAVYLNGRFDQFLDKIRDQCKEAEFKPFPELQALAR
jgi:hypothetical protein